VAIYGLFLVGMTWVTRFISVERGWVVLWWREGVCNVSIRACWTTVPRARNSAPYFWTIAIWFFGWAAATWTKIVRELLPALRVSGEGPVPWVLIIYLKVWCLGCGIVAAVLFGFSVRTCELSIVYYIDSINKVKENAWKLTHNA
jgi:hypothetical protein